MRWLPRYLERRRTAKVSHANADKGSVVNANSSLRGRRVGDIDIRLEELGEALQELGASRVNVMELMDFARDNVELLFTLELVLAEILQR